MVIGKFPMTIFHILPISTGYLLLTLLEFFDLIEDF